jgi:uncharacterized protein YecE (DUF72 family)
MNKHRRQPMSAKRDRDADAPSAPQTIEERGEEKIVKNSPYGKARAGFGWGSPFAPPAKGTIPAQPQVRVGLSSLNGVPSKQRGMAALLALYQKKYSCLEHCQTYHQMHDPAVWAQWKALCRSDDFVFTIKANQYLTHHRLLEVDADTLAHIDKFFGERCVGVLGKQLGAVLLQLPPSFKRTPEHLGRLRAVAQAVPAAARVAVEFRHASWYCEEVYAVLRAAKWALVHTHNFDVGDGPVVDTGCGFMYVRLMGAVGQYVGDYGRPAMQHWADIVRRFIAANGPAAPVYFFLNNNESHVGGLTSGNVDAAVFAEIMRSAAAAAVAPPVAVASPPAPPAAAAATPPHEVIEL